MQHSFRSVHRSKSAISIVSAKFFDVLEKGMKFALSI